MVLFVSSTSYFPIQYANPKTIGYVTSGFWCGISVGRLVWGYGVPQYVSISCSLIEEYPVIQGYHLSASIRLNVNMPFRDACMSLSYIK